MRFARSLFSNRQARAGRPCHRNASRVTGVPPVRAISTALIALALAGCHRNDMAGQDRKDPMEPSTMFVDGNSARPLVVGTVPRDRNGAISMATRSGPVSDYDGLTGAGYSTTRPSMPDSAPIPFELTLDDLNRGQQRFNIYCSMCHGQTGEGNGMIVQRGFVRPPSYFPLAADKTLWPDLYAREQALMNQPIGYIFNVITNGHGAMYSYAERVPPDDRWKIAAYVKALQMSRNPNPKDLTAADNAAMNQQASTATPDSAKEGDSMNSAANNPNKNAGGIR